MAVSPLMDSPSGLGHGSGSLNFKLNMGVILHWQVFMDYAACCAAGGYEE
jgi:hypothetical protein